MERTENMNIVDKFQAKRLGVSEERYRESEKIAMTIWNNLISEGKVMNPYIHIKLNKGFVVVEMWFIISIVNFILFFYSNVFNLAIPKKEILIIGIIHMLLFLVGMFIMYRHDIKQFEKRVEEISKVIKESGEHKFIVPVKKYGYDNKEIVREVIIQTDRAEMARLIAIGDFQHDGWIVDTDYQNYKQFKG